MNAAPAESPSSINGIVESLRLRVSPARFKQMETLVRLFFQRVSDEDLGLRSVAGWASLVSGIFDFLQVRKAESASVRVFNPGKDDEGWETSHTVIQVMTDDMPFLVDSVGMAISACENVVRAGVHPVFLVERDAGGHLLSIAEEGHAETRGKPESLMHFEVDRRAEPEELERLRNAVVEALFDVRAAVRDWPAMRDKLESIATQIVNRDLPMDADGKSELQAFLRWLGDDHFTLLGYRAYETVTEGKDDFLRAIPGSGLGILREADTKPRPLKTLAARDVPRAEGDKVVIVTKTNARASVHRPGYMDYIGVLSFDANGKAIGEERILGLFTSSAYTARPWTVPMLRRKYEQLMTRSGFKPGGHSAKALRHILETLPRDEFLQASSDELYQISMAVLALHERQRTRLFVRRDVYGRFYSCLVYIPRDRFNQDTRERIESLLRRAFSGERVDSAVHMGEEALARLHLTIRPKAGDRPTVDVVDLESRIAQLVRNWYDELRDALVQKHGEERGLKLAGRYGKALPAGYIEESSTSVAAQDVEIAAALKGPEDIRLSLYRPPHKADNVLRFKLFRYGAPISLSEALPLMENLGLKVLSEHPFQMQLSSDSRIHIQDFEVQSASGETIDVDQVRDAFQSAFERIWRNDAESDGFNRLILAAHLQWRQVAMLRGYCKYLLQTGVPFSQTYMEEALQRYPLLARMLVELFETKFDPARSDPNHVDAARKLLARDIQQLLPKNLLAAASNPVEALLAVRSDDRQVQIDASIKFMKGLLDRVTSLDDDRILRSFISLIQATLRTGFYQHREGRPRDYISFKFDPARVPDLPKPRPYREVFVYSPRVEGVHLRFGPVARGGLRWSDRREDFRTEVLGLVKAQMVKNTVIVPVGAKGGFFVKRPPVAGDRDAQLAEGVACYRMFINGLLDITDNLIDGNVVHPQDVVRHDADDPYLVVAADKGTATFSDIANSVAAEHGFWLGDAFASGGSQGYDHKGMGITAKGGWESVKRHFRALGRDSQTQDFTCVGVGDMSGDVFGNGMLLSEHIRLIAAFDHRHIFVDPNPDAASSFKERSRMFALPRSSWDDYDRKLISAGGGVFPRSAKAIAISVEMHRALGLIDSVDSMSPNELMAAILRAPVDLLWNGGIGTYVKASTETHADCGDRANNAIRLNGRDLRSKIVGEGGNLGMSQKGRIEAALHGVLLNTDFIDNSAGVDTSDHEVNIKILLDDAVGRGELTVTDRNVLLASMTDEVGALVLRDNYLQNQAISVMERMSVSRLGSKQHFIRTLETAGQLDRVMEDLPSDSEFAERRSRGQGLTRPELSILLSYSKIVLFNQLLDSDVPEDPYMAKELVRYFPKPLQERFRDHMERHRLRREIVTTAVTNSMVNRMGATFAMRMREDTGESPAEIAKAYAIAREVLDARALWNDIERMDGKIHGDAQIDALLRVWNLMRYVTRWLLNLPGAKLNIAESVERYGSGIVELRAGLANTLADAERVRAGNDADNWVKAGFSAELSEKLSLLPALASVFDIIEVALDRKQPLLKVAEVYYGLGETLSLKWLMGKIEELPVEGRWHALARGVSRDELFAQQRVLAAQVLTKGGKGDGKTLVANWIQRDDPALKFTLSMFADMRSQLTMDYPTVSVAVRRLAQLAQAGART
ncbi:MAG: NAD-glutamate dehydrogenase [Pseudomonadota bacterium]|nr:NAD-glutamate dehydrogenase [Pseudomonadota bacterium]